MALLTGSAYFCMALDMSDIHSDHMADFWLWYFLL